MSARSCLGTHHRGSIRFDHPRDHRRGRGLAASNNSKQYRELRGPRKVPSSTAIESRCHNSSLGLCESIQRQSPSYRRPPASVSSWTRGWFQGWSAHAWNRLRGIHRPAQLRYQPESQCDLKKEGDASPESLYLVLRFAHRPVHYWLVDECPPEDRRQGTESIGPCGRDLDRGGVHRHLNVTICGRLVICPRPTCGPEGGWPCSVRACWDVGPLGDRTRRGWEVAGADRAAIRAVTGVGLGGGRAGRSGGGCGRGLVRRPSRARPGVVAVRPGRWASPDRFGCRR